jgi:hypothetical protein
MSDLESKGYYSGDLIVLAVYIASWTAVILIIASCF